MKVEWACTTSTVLLLQRVVFYMIWIIFTLNTTLEHCEYNLLRVWSDVFFLGTYIRHLYLHDFSLRLKIDWVCVFNSIADIHHKFITHNNNNYCSIISAASRCGAYYHIIIMYYVEYLARGSPCLFHREYFNLIQSIVCEEMARCLVVQMFSLE